MGEVDRSVRNMMNGLDGYDADALKTISKECLDEVEVQQRYLSTGVDHLGQPLTAETRAIHSKAMQEAMKKNDALENAITDLQRDKSWDDVLKR